MIRLKENRETILMGQDDYLDPDGWWAHTGYEVSHRRFLSNWGSVIQEMGLRYGSGLAGWFFDDGGDGIFKSGPQKGLKAHTNFILESNWWHDSLNTPIAPPMYPLEQFLHDMEEASRFGIVPSINLEIYQEGGISQESLRYLKKLDRLLPSQSRG